MRHTNTSRLKNKFDCPVQIGIHWIVKDVENVHAKNGIYTGKVKYNGQIIRVKSPNCKVWTI